jgi:hypothetical protein
MTITLDIKPEVHAELARQAAVQGRASRVSKLRFHNTTHPLLGYGAYTPEKGS